MDFFDMLVFVVGGGGKNIEKDFFNAFFILNK
jgi:hypothetical protein